MRGLQGGEGQECEFLLSRKKRGTVQGKKKASLTKSIFKTSKASKGLGVCSGWKEETAELSSKQSVLASKRGRGGNRKS